MSTTTWKRGGPSPNPSGRPRRSAERTDAWVNVLAGINTSRDKRTAGRVAAATLDYAEMRTLWRHDDIAALTIETVPGEMFREGFKFVHADAKLVAQVSAEVKRLKLRARLKRACEFERAYGGAAILPVTNDGALSLAEPLNPDTITRIHHLVVLEPRELMVHSYDEDIESPAWRKPLTYSLQPAGTNYSGKLTPGTVIHRSRMIVFDGRCRSNDPSDGVETGGYAGWGDSVLIPIHAVIRDFQIGWSSASLLLVDFAQGVYKMKGLVDMLKGNEALVRKRLEIMELTKSVVKAIVIDADDEYSRQQTPISGLPETLDRLASRVCAAARLPVTKLMGQSPKGLGNEGDSDIAFLYDQVAQEQDDKLPLIEQAIGLILAQREPFGGKRKAIKDWKIEFGSLWQPTDREMAETRKIVMDTDAIAIDKGIITPDEVRRTRYGGDGFQLDLLVGDDADDLNGVDPDRAAAMAGDLRAPVVEPPDGAGLTAPAAAALGAGAKTSDTAMNGAQVASLLEVIGLFNRGELSSAQATAVIQRAFNVGEADADRMIDESFASSFQRKTTAPAAAPQAAPAAAPTPPRSPPPAAPTPPPATASAEA